MSTSVYRIGPEEQLKTIIEICQDSPGERVILVMPEAAVSLMSTANLRLLAAYAADYGKTLVLVTGNRVLQDLAQRAGIAVYADLQQAELARGPSDQDSRRPEREVIPEASPTLPERTSTDSSSETSTRRKAAWPVRLGIVCVAILASVLVYYLVTPKVILTIHPATESVSFRANQLLFVGDGLVPLTHELSGTISVPATGSRVVGDRASTGEVIIYNLGLEPVTIPEGSEISSLGSSKQKFVVVEAVDVPVGSVVAGKVVSAGKASVPVRAAVLGSRGNLPKGTEFQFAGAYAELPLVVSNAADFAGGTDRLLSVVTQTDIESAKAKLRQELMARAEKEWYDRAATEDGVVVPEQRLHLSEEYAVGVKPGDTADTVTARGTISVSGWVIDSKTLWSIVKDGLARVQAPGYQVLEDSLHIQSVKLREAAESNDAVELIADVAVSRITELDDNLEENLAGVAVAELPHQLAELGASPQYSLHPEEIDYLPRWSGWIKVEISGQN